MLVFIKFFSDQFFTQRITLFIEKIFLIRVDRRVIGVEELESDVSFYKIFFGSIFYTKDHTFYRINFFNKG